MSRKLLGCVCRLIFRVQHLRLDLAMVLYRDLSEGHANSPSKPLMPMPLSVLHDACSQGLLQSAHLSWKAASHPGWQQ